MSEEAVGQQDAAEVMRSLHIDIGQRAAELALRVLENTDPDKIPIPAAVSLLKFGVELERKSVLGKADEDEGPDLFSALFGELGEALAGSTEGGEADE